MIESFPLPKPHGSGEHPAAVPVNLEEAALGSLLRAADVIDSLEALSCLLAWLGRWGEVCLVLTPSQGPHWGYD